MSIDNFIIGVSVGIGRSIAEAEIALKEAKEKKENPGEDIRIGGPYNISVYTGEPLGNSEIQEDSRVKDYFDLVKMLDGKFIERVDSLVKYDKHTGALTPLGYAIELASMDKGVIDRRKTKRKESERRKKGKERVIFLFDANDMHYWNEKVGYDEVTRHLHAIGKALVDHTSKSRRDKVTKANGLVHRLHGGAGDEFIVDGFVTDVGIDALPVAKRLIKAIYQEQEGLYKS